MRTGSLAFLARPRRGGGDAVDAPGAHGQITAYRRRGRRVCVRDPQTFESPRYAASRGVFSSSWRARRTSRTRKPPSRVQWPGATSLLFFRSASGARTSWKSWRHLDSCSCRSGLARTADGHGGRRHARRRQHPATDDGAVGRRAVASRRDDALSRDRQHGHVRARAIRCSESRGLRAGTDRSQSSLRSRYCRASIPICSCSQSCRSNIAC
jgi:hypothetical protein